MRSVFPNIFQALWYQRISVCSKAYAFWRSGRVCAHVGTWCVCAGARIRETFKSTKAIFYDPEPQEQEQGRPIIGTSISCKPMRMVSPVKQLPTSDGQGPSSYFTSNILDHVMVPREVAWGRRSQTSLHFHRGHFAPALCLMVGDQERWGNHTTFYGFLIFPHHLHTFPYQQGDQGGRQEGIGNMEVDPFTLSSIIFGALLGPRPFSGPGLQRRTEQARLLLTQNLLLW